MMMKWVGCSLIKYKIPRRVSGIRFVACELQLVLVCPTLRHGEHYKNHRSPNKKKSISFLSSLSDTLPRDHWKLIGQKMTMHFYVEEFAHSEFFLLRLLKSFSISQVWLSDTCQSNFAIADISGGSWHYVDNKRCPMINLADKQFNPKGSKVVQTWSLNGKVDNWHLMLATLELDVTFENIYAVTDHWLNFPSPQRILKGKAYSLAGCDVWKEEE